MTLILVLAPLLSVDFNFSTGKIDTYSSDFEAKKADEFIEKINRLEAENERLKKKLEKS